MGALFKGGDGRELDAEGGGGGGLGGQWNKTCRREEGLKVVSYSLVDS